MNCRMCGTEYLINEETGICVECEMEHLLDEDEEEEPIYRCRCGMIVDEEDTWYPCPHIMPELY